MEDLSKALATGAVTLIVGFVLLQAQLGGRRRRLRREVGEELELLQKVDAEVHPETHRRLSARVTVMLKRYEGVLVNDDWSWPQRIAIASWGAIAASGGAWLGFLPDGASWTKVLSVGVVSGGLASALVIAMHAYAARHELEEAIRHELADTGSTELEETAASDD